MFFGRGIADEAIDAVKRVNRLRDLRAEYLRRLESVRAPALLLRLVDELFVTPVITINGAAKLLGVAYTSARKNVEPPP